MTKNAIFYGMRLIKRNGVDTWWKLLVWFEESNADEFEDDEAEETQKDQEEKVINEDEEWGRAMVPVLLDFGRGIVHFFDLRHSFELQLQTWKWFVRIARLEMFWAKGPTILLAF